MSSSPEGYASPMFLDLQNCKLKKDFFLNNSATGILLQQHKNVLKHWTKESRTEDHREGDE
jgi:hypothetical protein